VTTIVVDMEAIEEATETTNAMAVETSVVKEMIDLSIATEMTGPSRMTRASNNPNIDGALPNV
jgi:hypothetical protein